MAKKTTESVAKKIETKTDTPKKETSKISTTKNVDLSNFLTEIESKAYEIFEERTRNNQSGNEMSDWLAAEAEIKKKYNIK